MKDRDGYPDEDSQSSGSCLVSVCDQRVLCSTCILLIFFKEKFVVIIFTAALNSRKVWSGDCYATDTKFNIWHGLKVISTFISSLSQSIFCDALIDKTINLINLVCFLNYMINRKEVNLDSKNAFILSSVGSDSCNDCIKIFITCMWYQFSTE